MAELLRLEQITIVYPDSGWLEHVGTQHRYIEIHKDVHHQLVASGKGEPMVIAVAPWCDSP